MDIVVTILIAVLAAVIIAFIIFTTVAKGQDEADQATKSKQYMAAESYCAVWCSMHIDHPGKYTEDDECESNIEDTGGEKITILCMDLPYMDEGAEEEEEEEEEEEPPESIGDILEFFVDSEMIITQKDRDAPTKNYKLKLCEKGNPASCIGKLQDMTAEPPEEISPDAEGYFTLCRGSGCAPEESIVKIKFSLADTSQVEIGVVYIMETELSEFEVQFKER